MNKNRASLTLLNSGNQSLHLRKPLQVISPNIYRKASGSSLGKCSPPDLASKISKPTGKLSQNRHRNKSEMLVQDYRIRDTSNADRSSTSKNRTKRVSQASHQSIHRNSIQNIRTSPYHCPNNTTPQSNSYIRNPKKLFIHSKQKSNHKNIIDDFCSVLEQLRLTLTVFTNRLEQILSVKSEKLFIQHYKSAIDNLAGSLQQISEMQKYNSEIYLIHENRHWQGLHKTNKSILGIVAAVRKCQEKQYQYKSNVFYESLKRLQKSKSEFSLRNKELMVRKQVLQSEIGSLKDKNTQLAEEMRRLRYKSQQEAEVQTEALQITHNSQLQANSRDKETIDFQQIQLKQKEDINELKQNLKVRPKEEIGKATHDHKQKQSQLIVKLIQQLRQYKAKQEQYMLIFCDLRKQGINVSNIYKKILRTKKANGDKAENHMEIQLKNFCPSSLSEMKVEEQKTDRKEIARNIKNYRQDQSQDADNSIVEDIDALSFDYMDKSEEMMEYTPRRVYKCKKKMDQELKDRLKLDFECLYESQDSFQEQQGKETTNSAIQKGPPTI